MPGNSTGCIYQLGKLFLLYSRSLLFDLPIIHFIIFFYQQTNFPLRNYSTPILGPCSGKNWFHPHIQGQIYNPDLINHTGKVLMRSKLWTLTGTIRNVKLLFPTRIAKIVGWDGHILLEALLPLRWDTTLGQTMDRSLSSGSSSYRSNIFIFFHYISQ